MQVTRKNEVIRQKLTVSRCRVTSKFSVSVSNHHVMADPNQPFWVSPCGKSSSTIGIGEKAPKKELIDNIVKVTKISQNAIKKIKKDFFKAIFGDVEYDEKVFSDALYDWLPSREDIPKKFGETLPNDHLHSVTFDALLPIVYTNLQMIAAGMEIVLQNEAYSGFKSTLEGHMKTVLCEIHDGLLFRNVDRPPDVARDIVPPGFRLTKDQTMSKMRDWIVFREFMNILEYILEVFSHLQTTA